MQLLCPNCDHEIEVEEIKVRRSYTVKKASIEIEDRFYRCSLCEEEWSVEGFDAMAEVYRIYRDLHRMVQPSVLKAWRKKWGLTQEELAKLLGWSEATVVRYEKGSLQEKSHDNELHMAMTPQGLKVLVEQTPDAIPQEKRASIEAGLKPSLAPENSVAEIFTSDEQTIHTGFQSCSLTKLKSVIAILVGQDDGVWKTTLNKLLWFSDFLHFREYGVGITGLTYQHLQFGPVPFFWNWLSVALSPHEFEFIIEDFSNGASGERIRAIMEPDEGILQTTEIEILNKVREKFGKKGAKEISELSHNEVAWVKTKLREVISYEWAAQMINV